MKLSTQPYKGTRDFYPEDKRVQKYMFGKLRQVVESYGYQEYDASIIEPFELYAAKSGEELVNEQLYWFEDRGGRKVAIRPEMTPTVSRMVAARRQELVYPLRWYSIPNMWRYERPQRGRLREFWQLNVDIFGVDNLNADAEIITIADALLKGLGAKANMYEIAINSKAEMVKAMLSFGLTEEELKKAYKVVDKMAKITEQEFKEILDENIGKQKTEKLLEYLSAKNPPENIQKLLTILKAAGVTSAKYEPAVVRGLDYYTDIVFEVFDMIPENRRAMFGGGRYDGLVELFGVEKVPTVGFGMGDVTLQNFLESNNLMPKLDPETQAIAILSGDVYQDAQKVLSDFRERGINLAVDISNRKIEQKVKSAVKSGAKFAIFIGEDELTSGKFKVKSFVSVKEKELTFSEAVRTILSGQ